MGKNLFVGNISFNTTEEELRDLFAGVAEIDDTDEKTPGGVFMPIDRMTGRKRGFAFVLAKTDEGAQAMIEAFNGKEVDGRELTVNEARPREERPAGSFSGNRGGGRDFRSNGPRTGGSRDGGHRSGRYSI